MDGYEPDKLSRRERQIMDLLFENEELSALDVQERMEDAPGYSAVRTMLRLLEEKGHVTHRTSGRKYLYTPVQSRRSASRGAMRRLLNTFFDNSAEQAIASLLDISSGKLNPEEYDRLSALIEKAKRQ